MCGRYNLITDAKALVDFFEVRNTLELQPRYNIAPSQDVPAVRMGEDGRELVVLRWGLIPHWAKEEQISYSMINARAETVADKPAFRSAFRRQRCLIPATGFYEWRKDAGGKTKTPYLIQVGNGELIAFAGLWEHWEGGEGKVVESCSIIVTDANETVRPIHDRMPVILDRTDYDAWLDPQNRDSEACRALLRSYPAERMNAQAVSGRVNNPKSDDPECVAPIQAE